MIRVKYLLCVLLFVKLILIILYGIDYIWKINFDYTLYVTRMFRLYPLFSEFFKRIFGLITTYPPMV